ncbi:hypothetical protein GA0115246_113972 [Streptomyces sp. SolWspMP-sol7th]|nr:hypothetical protein GA0115246_113972 [Streptomyces sp. SolWspMP-sol7th]
MERGRGGRRGRRRGGRGHADAGARGRGYADAGALAEGRRWPGLGDAEARGCGWPGLGDARAPGRAQTPAAAIPTASASESATGKPVRARLARLWEPPV